MSLSTTKLPRLFDNGCAVELHWRGEVHRFHAIWLRDNAPDAATRSPTNGQRLISVLDVPRDIRVSEASWTDDRLRVRFEPEGKNVDYDPDWLLAHAYDKPSVAAIGWTADDITRWDASLSGEIAVETYQAVCDDASARLRWLRAVARYGFARMTEVPAIDGIACEIAEMFGYVRETNYGRAFDVRAEVDANNLAYTNLGLQAHTDNPYRDPVPGLQILACLENDVEGGESIVVDGFRAAERLQAETPHGFTLLSRHCARFEYAGSSGVCLRSKRPMIELGPDGELIAIRFNNRSAATLTDIPFDNMADYYAAYRRMAELVEDPALSIRFRLAPGELFIVDNLRVLHARTAFTDGGVRWLQGCYADRDGLLSTIAALDAAGTPVDLA
jgi:gamma-butyrobetaine dioxygenase